MSKDKIIQIYEDSFYDRGLRVVKDENGFSYISTNDRFIKLLLYKPRKLRDVYMIFQMPFQNYTKEDLKMFTSDAYNQMKMLRVPDLMTKEQAIKKFGENYEKSNNRYFEIR